MQNNAAVYRTQESLAEGKNLIDDTVKRFEDVKVLEFVSYILTVVVSVIYSFASHYFLYR